MMEMTLESPVRYPLATAAHLWTALANRREQAMSTLNERLSQGINLRSRRGIDGAIWTILTVSLVAAIAAAVLFTLGPRLLALGRNAVTRVQSPPW
jgi:hypothetical protein